MIDNEVHEDEKLMYGPWTWIVGLAFGVLLMVILFVLADGFA